MKKDLVPTIKYLFDKNYPNKAISFITGTSKSYLSKIKNNQLHKNTDSCGEISPLSDSLFIRYKTIEKIISNLQSLETSDETEKIKYILLLRFLGIKKEAIREIFKDVNNSKFQKYYSNKILLFNTFNSELIGIDKNLFSEVFQNII